MAPAPAVRARIRRAFAAQAEDVFDAWIDPAKVREWFAPGLGEMQQVDADPRVGGTFCFVQRRGDDDVAHTGEYLELERPRLLAFTWQTPPLPDRSRVKIDIVSTGDGCDLTLIHEMEPQWAAKVEQMERGWSTMLDGMATFLEQRADASRNDRP
ncbi:MAG: SRPBCC domain-containing protein [Vicinamibacteraceae bacterium]